MLERMWRKRNPPYTIGGNVDWYSHYREQYGGSKKQPKVELAYDPAIPLLGLYQEKILIRRDPCIPIFTIALFSIAKT